MSSSVTPLHIRPSLLTMMYKVLSYYIILTLFDVNPVAMVAALNHKDG